ncbi:MAG TPA: DUF3416 domain-containing protein [Corynebacteriales bacterium]|nr:DUF3416 domain-containing protein [Mycobacteriales bacterium]
MVGRFGITDVQPVVDCGSSPAKGTVGEVLPVSATVWREGHDALSATLWVKGPEQQRGTRITMVPGKEDDTFHSCFCPDAEGMWTFRVDAWSDPRATWMHDVTAKVDAGQSAADLANDLEIGARILDKGAKKQRKKKYREALTAAAQQLRDESLELSDRLGLAMSEKISNILAKTPVRELVTRGKRYRVWVDRQRAMYSAWYELFPRSTGGRDENGMPIHGTFATTEKELPRIAKMGFNVVYFPPIHPIGEVNRKGRNNTLTAAASDVGSPWAIGSRHGGHDAIHPELGTLKDFRKLLRTAKKLGLEIALDLALQCAPDHPWAQEHPEWFDVLPDGTIRYAENPPKKYQDIYPLNFDKDYHGLTDEVERVVRFWMKQGVRIFRVDNPHTKPPMFWEELISRIKLTDPDVLFLSEAFTRPARMFGLAQLGFSQSYTYFTWKTAKWELEQFAAHTVEHLDQARPNLFTNTPDILHASLQSGGPGMFAIRATLAATMFASWGVYSGLELYEHIALKPGSEEYLHSEKYELRPRDFEAALEAGESLEPWLTTLNEIREKHPALQQNRQLHFHHCDNDAIIAYSKFDPVTGDHVLVIVNLNSFEAQETTIRLDMPALGMDWFDRFAVYDEVSKQTFNWGSDNYVKLEPWDNVAHILVLPDIPEERRADLCFRETNTD